MRGHASIDRTNSWKTIKEKHSLFAPSPYATASCRQLENCAVRDCRCVHAYVCACACVSYFLMLIAIDSSIDRHTLAPVTDTIRSFIDFRLSIALSIGQAATCRLPHAACCLLHAPTELVFAAAQCAICRSCCCCCCRFYGNIQVSTLRQISCLLLHELIDSYLRQLLLPLPLLQHSACLLRRLRVYISVWAAKLGEDD